jgi:hypothetical protein
MVHATAIGIFGGSLLGAALAVFVAWLGYGTLDLAAAAVAVYAGLAAGGWCGLIVAPAAFRACRPGVTAVSAALIGAGIGALFGGFVGKIPNEQWHVSLACLGGLAGAGEGLALCGASRWLRRRERPSADPEGAPIEDLSTVPLPPGQEAALVGRTEEAAVLQKQALRFGRATVSVRFVLPALGGAGVLTYMLYALHWGLQRTGFVFLIEGALLLPFALGTALASLPVSLGLAMLCRRWSLRRLRRQLAPLPLDERRELLLALNQSTPPEIREMSAPLLRELSRRGGEITPAASLEGRGDELRA